jgi:hypothetical protein
MCSQEVSVYPFSEPDESIRTFTFCFLEITLHFPPIYASVFTDFSFLRVFRLQYYINYSLRFYEYILIKQALVLRGLLYTVFVLKHQNSS